MPDMRQLTLCCSHELGDLILIACLLMKLNDRFRMIQHDVRSVSYACSGLRSDTSAPEVPESCLRIVCGPEDICHLIIVEEVNQVLAVMHSAAGFLDSFVQDELKCRCLDEEDFGATS
jgi:hypothetical protein